MISIVQRKSENLRTINGESLFVKFSYSQEILAKIKTFSERWWHPSTKEWELPCAYINELMGMFDVGDLRIDENVDLDYEEPKQSVISENGRIEVFKEELGWVKDDKLRDFCIEVLSLLPEYFFHVPASSTGKYHPDYALGEGGLVRHTKGALKIAHCLFDNETIQSFADIEKDMILVAICLHDGCKHGFGDKESQYTTFNHPISVTTFIENKIPEVKSKNAWMFIRGCIQSHMGRYNVSKDGKIILPVPKTDAQKFVHLCDYLGSRRFLEVKFDK